jgi:hypothetical protein
MNGHAEIILHIAASSRHWEGKPLKGDREKPATGQPGGVPERKRQGGFDGLSRGGKAAYFGIGLVIFLGFESQLHPKRTVDVIFIVHASMLLVAAMLYYLLPPVGTTRKRWVINFRFFCVVYLTLGVPAMIPLIIWLVYRI